MIVVLFLVLVYNVDGFLDISIRKGLSPIHQGLSPIHQRLSPIYQRLSPIHSVPISLANLESIASSRAVISTLTARFQQEFISDNTILSEVVYHRANYTVDLLYLILFGASIYIRTHYTANLYKLEKFESFSRSRRLTNMIVIFITVVFVKNVENVI